MIFVDDFLTSIFFFNIISFYILIEYWEIDNLRETPNKIFFLTSVNYHQEITMSGRAGKYSCSASSTYVGILSPNKFQI